MYLPPPLGTCAHTRLHTHVLEGARENPPFLRPLKGISNTLRPILIHNLTGIKLFEGRPTPDNLKGTHRALCNTLPISPDQCCTRAMTANIPSTLPKHLAEGLPKQNDETLRDVRRCREPGCSRLATVFGRRQVLQGFPRASPPAPSPHCTS